MEAEASGEEGLAAKVALLSRDTKMMDGQDAGLSKDIECAAKDAPLSGDDRKSSENSSKVKERTRIISSSLLEDFDCRYRYSRANVRP